MNHDISQILEDWKYDPESNVRRIRGEDGVAKIQVRVDQGAFQGILQLNLDGRPDGKRPHDRDFALDHYRATRDEHERRVGKVEGFQLDHPSCEELFEESAQVYGRYVFLLQVKDYERVIRDTERNMNCFEFLYQYAALEDDRQQNHGAVDSQCQERVQLADGTEHLFQLRIERDVLLVWIRPA